MQATLSCSMATGCADETPGTTKGRRRMPRKDARLLGPLRLIKCPPRTERRGALRGSRKPTPFLRVIGAITGQCEGAHEREERPRRNGEIRRLPVFSVYQRKRKVNTTRSPGRPFIRKTRASGVTSPTWPAITRRLPGVTDWSAPSSKRQSPGWPVAWTNVASTRFSPERGRPAAAAGDVELADPDGRLRGAGLAQNGLSEADQLVLANRDGNRRNVHRERLIRLGVVPRR